MHSNDVKTTGIFVAVAVVLALVAFMTTPGAVEVNEEDKVGELLCPAFTADSAVDLVGLEVASYDQSKGDTVDFEVSRASGAWTIPSEENYPADAEDHLGRVAAQLLNLRALSVALTSAEVKSGDRVKLHRKFGVVDPTGKNVGKGEGVGTRVTLHSASAKDPVLDLIVGDPLPDQPSLRHVRIADQDPVYTTEISLASISTDFGDWIERNPLDIDSMDINQVTIFDYFLKDVEVMTAIGPAIATQPEMRDIIELDYDDMASPKWTFVSDRGVDAEGQPIDKPLAENEELDTDRLNDLRRALSDLKIVDVARKPEALAKSLAERGQIPQRDQEADDSLAGCGFYLSSDPYDPNRASLLSNQGQTVISMKDGVQYVLRFGELTGGGEAGSHPESDASQASEGEAEVAKETSGGLHRYLFVMAQFDPSLIPAPETQPLPELPGEPADGESPPAEADTDAILAERERIQLENQRAMDDYQKTVEEARKRVAELNRRFAPWYYVIDETVFEDIHLTRADIVREKEPEEEAAAGSNGVPGTSPDGSNPGGFTLPPYDPSMEDAPPAPPAAPEGSFDEFEELEDSSPKPAE